MVGQGSLAGVLVTSLTVRGTHLVTCHYSAPRANMTDDTHMLSTGHPRCAKHGRLCSLRVVRKDGENKGRQFYTCPLPRETQCDYFQVRIRLQGRFSNEHLFLQPLCPSNLIVDRYGPFKV